VHGGIAVLLEAAAIEATHMSGPQVVEAERALRENASTLAVAPIPELFADNGYLAALRARGYEVVEPE
jgi:hypothetical protein